jgi:hypothetical protein
MAQLGFIVIAVGHRGDSPMRGKTYHRFGYGNMRDYPLADDKYAIEQLASPIHLLILIRWAFMVIRVVALWQHQLS